MMKAFFQNFITKTLTSFVLVVLVGISKLKAERIGKIVCALLPAWEHLTSKIANHPGKTELLASTRAILLNVTPPEAHELIPSLEKRDRPVSNTWNYQNEVMKWNIASNHLVLDIGSGGWPFKRADHLADRFPDKTTHRVEVLARDERPFIAVNIENLPFKALSYDFTFCSHLLEHVDNPGRAIRELMRVGRRGYIEVPTRLSDIMFNFTRIPNHHRWHGIVQNNTLVLIEWNDWERRELGNHYFNSLQSDYKNPFQDFFERNRDLFFASYHWDHAINFLIIDKQGRVIDSSRGSG